MTRLITLLFLQAILSCNNNTSDPKAVQNDSANAAIIDTEDIFGSWSMCSIPGKGNTMIQMNVCPRVVFQKYGTGTVTYGNTPSLENFKWTLKSSTMKIIYPNKNADWTFPDTIYYTKFNKGKDGIDLVLTHNGQSYYLRKTIQE